MDAAALRMQALRASLRTDMVVWSSLAEAVASELQRIAPSLSLSLSLSSLSSSSHALPYPTLPASLSDTVRPIQIVDHSHGGRDSENPRQEQQLQPYPSQM